MKFKMLVVLILLVFALSGCQSDRNEAGKTSSTLKDSEGKGIELNMDDEAKKQAERAKQTLWYQLDDKGNKEKNLPDDYPEVQKVKKLVVLHAGIVDNRDYNTVNTNEEFSLYTKGFEQELKSGEYDKALISMYKDYLIKTKQGIIAWYESTFNKDFTSCKITIESEFEILECAKAYLDKNKLKLNTIYQQQRIIYLQKEDAVWKISNIQKSALYEKKKMTP